MRLNQRLDLGLTISQSYALNFSSYPAFRIRCGNLLQTHHPRLRRFDLSVLPSGIARTLDHVTANRKRNRSYCDQSPSVELQKLLFPDSFRFQDATKDSAGFALRQLAEYFKLEILSRVLRHRRCFLRAATMSEPAHRVLFSHNG